MTFDSDEIVGSRVPREMQSPVDTPIVILKHPAYRRLRLLFKKVGRGVREWMEWMESSQARATSSSTSVHRRAVKSLPSPFLRSEDNFTAGPAAQAPSSNLAFRVGRLSI